MIKYLIHNLVFLIFLCLINESHASSIESLVQEGMSKSQNMASNEQSGSNIPGYSREKAESHANDIDQMDDADMKSQSHQKMLSASNDSPEGITRDAMNKKTLSGYEDTEIFKKAEVINADPISALERIMSTGCKEKENEQKQIYKKVVKKELVTDTEIYEETCEKPAGGINCEKMLNVSCEATEECEAGSIELGSVDSSVDWSYHYPYLKIGTKHGYSDFTCGRNCCGTAVIRGRFKLRDTSEIRKFKLYRIESAEHVMVKVNGHVAYNIWGGYKLELTNRYLNRGQHGASRRIDSDTPADYKKFIDAGNGRGSTCLFNDGIKSTIEDRDLRPYFREGWNDIEITMIYTGSGHVMTEFEVRQQCCTKLTDKWEKRCWEQ